MSDKLGLVTTGGAVSGRLAQFQNPFEYDYDWGNDREEGATSDRGPDFREISSSYPQQSIIVFVLQS
jgi:hypothetical protein